MKLEELFAASQDIFIEFNDSASLMIKIAVTTKSVIFALCNAGITSPALISLTSSNVFTIFK